MEREFSIAFNTVIKMVDGFFAILPNLLIALCVYLVFSLISRLSSKATFNMARKARMDRTLAAALGKLIGISTVILGLLICAVIVVPSFSPDKLVAGLGITSVAIGFAFQNILQNF